MFAIFPNKGMDPFYQNISSFPTVIFTVVLALCSLYWLFAFLGIVDLDILDIDTGHEINAADALAGVMLKIGLNDVPVTIILSFLSLFGWFICYYTIHFLSPFIPSGILYFLFGLAIFVGTLLMATLLTAGIVKRLRPFFYKAEQHTIKRIIGQSAVVRSSKVTSTFGEVFFNDGGAGLILKVRSNNNQTFVKGDKVTLLEYLENKNIYHVISEQEFNR